MDGAAALRFDAAWNALAAANLNNKVGAPQHAQICIDCLLLELPATIALAALKPSLGLCLDMPPAPPPSRSTPS